MKHIILGAGYMKKTSLSIGLFSVPRQIVSWYCMKFLHLWRGNELLEITLNSSERNQSLRDPQQINFIMLMVIMWKTLHPLFLTDNTKLDGMPTKIKLKIQACFTLYFKFWEGTSAKSYKIQLPVLLFLVSHQFLYQQISFFTTF